MPAPDLGAVEYEVSLLSTNADGGVGSLRYALIYTPIGATISFSTNLSGRVLLLTNGVFSLNNNVTIDGSALPNGILLNGDHSTPIFNVPGGVTAILNSLTMSNGYSASGYGGAVLSFGNLTINNCKLVNNQCAGTAGALAAAFGSLTLSNTTVAGNVCDNCSAIYIQDQPATLIGCTVSGNSGYYGDALRLQAAGANTTLMLLNSTFAGNVATNGAGAAISIGSAWDWSLRF